VHPVDALGERATRTLPGRRVEPRPAAPQRLRPPALSGDGAKVLPPPPPLPQTAAPDPLPRRAATWLRSRAGGLSLASGLLLLVTLALVHGIQRFPAVTDDEGTYVAQAWAFRTTGSLAHYTYWYDHPPLGWMQLAALHEALSFVSRAPTAVLDARYVMLVPALASVALVYVLARRCGLTRPFAALATLAFGLSPLSVAFMREVLLDGFALPWMLAAFVLTLSPSRRLWSFAAAGTCAAISVLSKETMILLVPALALALWQQCDRRTRAFCVTAFLVPFVLVGAGYPLFALLKGEMIPGPGHVSLLDATWFQMVDRPSTGSLLDPSSTSRAVLDSWLSIDAILPIVGPIALPFASRDRTLRPIALAFGVLLLAAVRPGYLPQAFVLGALPFAAVMSAGVLQRTWRWARPKVTRPGSTPWAGAVVLAVFVVPLVAIGAHWNGMRLSQDAYDANRPYVRATRWIERHVPARDRVLVDDTFFVDLAESGFRPGLGVVWFYKLDTTTNLDPSVVRALPRGAAEFDVVVSTPIMRSALRTNPGALGEVRRAVRLGRVVKSFGNGAGQRVDIRVIGARSSNA
jgi:hypothetical protein